MDEIIKAVQSHAAEVAPQECCGLVVNRGGKMEYVPCRNVASEPTERFAIDPKQYAEIEDADEIVMIAHSHAYQNPKPSEADLVGCEKSGLPWLIVNHPTGAHTLTHPGGFKLPLLGRSFCKGLVDCYALVRDYYHIELGIDLPDYDRPEVWFEVGRSLILERFESAGFKPVDSPQINDLAVMTIGASVPNHVAVFVDDNKILHHVINRLSGYDVFGGYWKKSTVMYLRYAK